MAGREVFVVGAGNSAGQAALHLAAHGTGQLERLILRDGRTRASDSVPAAALFI